MWHYAQMLIGHSLISYKNGKKKKIDNRIEAYRILNKQLIYGKNKYTLTDF